MPAAAVLAEWLGRAVIDLYMVGWGVPPTIVACLVVLASAVWLIVVR